MNIYAITRYSQYKVIQKFEIIINRNNERIQQWILNGLKPCNIHCISYAICVRLIATATAATTFIFFVVATTTSIVAATIATTTTATAATTAH